MFDYDIFTDAELEQAAKDAQHQKNRAEAQAQSAEGTIKRILTELAERAIRRKSIRHGDLVTVRFSDGQEDFRFEGIDRDCPWGRPRIRLRAFTKKGKPFKQANSKAPSIIPFMTRKEQVHG